MTHAPLESIPSTLRPQVAQLAAEVIEEAASVGYGHWGLTQYVNGFRINVGWTEIFTALPEHIRLLVDWEHARRTALPQGVSLSHGTSGKGFYPTVPGSVLAEVAYEPAALYQRAIDALRPALTAAIRLAARRPAGAGVKAGHSQEAVLRLSAIVGRPLPAPAYLSERNALSEHGLMLMEGAMRRVVSSKYERSASARRACIEHYGTSCSVCGFSFEAVFGPPGIGFIHVHHVTPVASIGSEYRVNPVADLRPVCPNCHAMLHSQDPPLTIEELQNIVAEYKDA